jgi:DNA-binding XRE family transcriptional regulator
LSGKNNRKLRALMAEKGMTQLDMAKKLKIGASTFNRKLNGIAPWYCHECVLVSKLFGKSISEVFSLDQAT